MPSPFPGMDPYLEGHLWSSFHFDYLGEIERQLAPKLKPRYVVRSERRQVLDTPEEVAISSAVLRPDVSIRATHVRGSAAAAVATPPPLRLETTMPRLERTSQRNINIFDTANRRLVTAVELLSPANKRGSGRGQYLVRRRKLLGRSAHLVEIDLVRAGQRVPMRQPLPPAPYFALIGRTETRPLVDVWPIGLREPLPSIPIPLLPGDADVSLDLQAALTGIYDLLDYARDLNYADSPEQPLATEDAVWADGLLRAAGLRQ